MIGSNEVRSLALALGKIEKALDGIPLSQDAVNVCGGKEYDGVRKLTEKIIAIAQKILDKPSTGGGVSADDLQTALASKIGVVQINRGTSFDSGEITTHNGKLLLSLSGANIASDNRYEKTIAEAFTEKQNTLVSGENIKTVNGQSIVGSGNLTVPVPNAAKVDNNDNTNRFWCLCDFIIPPGQEIWGTNFISFDVVYRHYGNAENGEQRDQFVAGKVVVIMKNNGEVRASSFTGMAEGASEDLNLYVQKDGDIIRLWFHRWSENTGNTGVANVYNATGLADWTNGFDSSANTLIQVNYHNDTAIESGTLPAGAVVISK